MGFFSSLFGGNKNNDVLKEIINDGAFLVDARSEGEFANGSAKGAANIPLDKVQSQLVKFKNKKNIVVFCRSGNRSSIAKTILEKNGFDNVTNGGTRSKVAKLLN